MSELYRVDSTPLDYRIIKGYTSIINSIGLNSFFPAITGIIRDYAPVDRLYCFGEAVSAPWLQVWLQYVEPNKKRIEDRTYARDYLPSDPLQAAIRLLDDVSDATVLVRATPNDISAASYRNLLKAARVIERISLVQRGKAGWRCLTVVRRAESGRFSDQELSLVTGIGRLILPIVDRHEAMVRPIAQRGVLELEARFMSLFPQLTRREVQVCARAAVGITTEGAAQDLGVGVSSILTYRRRAYERLGVNTANQLAHLVLT